VEGRPPIQAHQCGPRLSRRAFVGSLSALLLLLAGCGLPTSRGPNGPARRIGYFSENPSLEPLDSFRQGLQERGWKDGQNLIIDYRLADGDFQRLAVIARELVESGVEVLVSGGAPAAQAAKAATSSIPIVMINVTDPVGQGLIVSLAHPGGNITGLTNSRPELSGKRLQLLKELLPGLAVVAIIWNPTNPGNQFNLDETRVAAAGLGVRLWEIAVVSQPELEVGLQTLAVGGVDALHVSTDGLLQQHQTTILEFAAQHGLPTSVASVDWVAQGGLMGYGIDRVDLLRRGGYVVDKVLRGASPGEIPVEQPTSFELVVNLTTAGNLGLTVPPEVASQVTQWVQ
jgi:putative tryptophan/tyrosine transport system substrate-binding protein